MMRLFLRILTTLAFGSWSATALGQARIGSITLKPISGSIVNQTVSLSINDAEADSILYIQGSADLANWEPLGQVIAGKTPTFWELQHANAASPYFFRVKVDSLNGVLEDGIYARITTNHGSMLAKLEYEKVPIIVANFIGLAEGTKSYSNDPQALPADPEGKPYYDGLIFHRVIKGFMIQGGCPLGTGKGNPGYWLPDQFHSDLKHDGTGILSMANSGEDINGSQFFITEKATPWLDFRHAVFGKVIEGINVVHKIANVETNTNIDKPIEDVVIESVRIIRQGEKAKAFLATEVAINQMLTNSTEEQMEFIQGELKIEPTQSGLIFQELQQGSGPVVTSKDSIEFIYSAEYLSIFLRGSGEFLWKEYDSTKDSDEQHIPQKINVSEVAPLGLKEAILKMNGFGIYRMYIPPELAYGTQGYANLGVPGHSVIAITIRLLGVTPGG